MIDFIHSLDAAYRGTGKATVQFHDTTLAAIRKLKNGNGQYIWSAGAAGAPANILDFTVTMQLRLEFGIRTGPSQPIERNRTLQIGIHENYVWASVSQICQQLPPLEIHDAVQFCSLCLGWL